MIKLLMFDLDGTLFHTGPGIHQAVNTLFGRLSLPEPSYDKVMSYIGDGLHKFMEHLGHDASILGPNVTALEQQFREIYDGVFRQSNLFNGVESFLDQWPHKLAVVSNKEEYYVKELIHHSPLRRFAWSAVIGGNTLPHKKPHPAPLFEACQAAGVEPSQALMIGDGLPDVLAAKEAGVKSIAVSFGYTPVSDLIQSGAHAVMNDYQELQNLISALSAH